MPFAPAHPKRHECTRVRHRGFTLVELIVVVLVIGLLASIAVVSFRSVADRAQNVKATANLHELQTAVMADGVLKNASVLSRSLIIDALDAHFPGGVAPGTKASGWGLLQVDDQSPDEATFAAGFDAGPGSKAVGDSGSRAAVVLHSGSGRSVALVMTLSSGAGAAPVSCTGQVASTVTPRLVLAGSDSTRCLSPALQAPPTPIGVSFTSTQTANGTVLSWADPLAVDVYRNGVLVAVGVPGTGWTDPNPVDGAVYTAVPVVGGAESTAVPVLAASTPVPVPPAPSAGAPAGAPPNLTLAGGTFTISWNAVPSSVSAPLSGYRLYRQPQGSANWAGLNPLWEGSATSATDTPDSSSTAWCYRVSAYGPGGESGMSDAACGATQSAPLTPSPTVTRSGSTFTIAWADVATANAPVTGYRVYRQPLGGTAWDQSTRIWDGTSLSTTDTPGTNSSATWVYRVSAYGPAGESPLSGGVYGALAAAPTAAPTSLTATPGDSRVSLSWPAVPVASNGGATLIDYQVSISPAPPTGAQIQRVGSTATSYVVTGLSNLTPYTFYVAAVNGAGVGASAHTAPTVPAATTVKFTSSGAWVVPAGVTSVTVTALGGGSGNGAAVVARVSVTAGQTYYATVGYGAGSGGYTGANGGGASDLRSSANTLASRLIVAGGGGGSQGPILGGAGGPVGGTAGTGMSSHTVGGSYEAGGAGATQTSGNALGQGGAGGTVNETYYSNGSGGGGGYWGGRGGNLGAPYGAGGGGGSSYIAPGVSLLSTVAGGNPASAASLTIAY